VTRTDSFSEHSNGTADEAGKVPGLIFAKSPARPAAFKWELPLMSMGRTMPDRKLPEVCTMKLLSTALFVFVSFLFSMSFMVRAGEPTDQLSGTVNKLTGMLASAPRSAMTSDELPERVATLIYERFDFPEMAKLSLGK
jgi:hypothetical protein